jgi:UDP-glucose 4-epimerase
MDKVIVTGGMGFIGRHVVSELLGNNFQVIIIDNLETNDPANVFKIPVQTILPTQPPPNGVAGLLRNDIRKMHPAELLKVMKGAKYVFHLAALPRVEPSIQDPAKYHVSNVDATLKIFIAAKEAGVERVIFSSSSSVYGNSEIIPTPEDSSLDPMSPYALHKLIGEQYLELFSKLYGLNSVSLRYFNVYGEGQPSQGAYVPVMGIFFRQSLASQPLSITGDGEQTRDFVNVVDVAKANLAAATADLENGHHVFNIGSGKNSSIKNIASQISPNHTNLPPRFEPSVTLADISKAEEKLGWKPMTSLNDWISENKPL